MSPAPESFKKLKATVTASYRQNWAFCFPSGDALALACVIDLHPCHVHKDDGGNRFTEHFCAIGRLAGVLTQHNRTFKQDWQVVGVGLTPGLFQVQVENMGVACVLAGHGEQHGIAVDSAAQLTGRPVGKCSKSVAIRVMKRAADRPATTILGGKAMCSVMYD